MSLKEKFAAKKAAKAEKKADKQAQKSLRVGKMGQTDNREHNAIIRRIQTANWADWANQIGTNLFSESICAKDEAERDFYWNNLIYEKNIIESLDFFHHQILNMHLFSILAESLGRGLGQFWRDSALKAEECLANSRGAWGQSPNQRRKHFGAVDTLIVNLNCVQAQLLPEKIGLRFCDYATAVMMAQGLVRFYTENQPQVIDSLMEIIRGKSLRQCAQFHQIKENQLRENVLCAASDLWKFGNCYKTLPVAYSIPDLRSENWQPFGDVHFIRNIIAQTSNQIIIPFEEHTGITLIDFAKFKRDLVQIETMWK